MNPRISPLILLSATAAFVVACGGSEPSGLEANAEQPVAGRSIPADSSSDSASDSASDSDTDRGCWSDRDCADGQTCRGARICPPGGLCGPLADQPGQCVDAGCDFEGQHYPTGAVFGACDACQCQDDGTVVCQDFVCLSCESDRDCPSGYACDLPCPPGGLCGPLPNIGYCMPVEPDPGSTTCTPEECGPAPAMPNQLCDDGIHYSGPGDCVRGDDGQCGWEILSCPTCGDTGCAAGELCLRTISGVPGGGVDERCIDGSRYLVCDEAPSPDVPPELANVSCGCLDLPSLCAADPICEEPDGKVIVTCTYR